VLRAEPTDDALGQAAARAGIPVEQPRSINAPDVVARLAALRPDLLVSVAYNQILRSEARGAAPLGALNLHAGKLPFYRGRNVVNWALINGEAEIGITAHLMDDGIDTGDIVLQRTLPVGWTDTYGDLLERIIDAVPALAVEAVDLVAAGAPVRPQRHLVGTYFGGRGPGDEWIDWSDSSVRLHNFIRAITRPGPGARTSLDGTEIVVWRAYHDRGWPSYIAIPGQVVGRGQGGAIVKTGDSTLLVQEIETNGRCGLPDWPVGTRLGAPHRHAWEQAR
jgi:methionyl-tRNA formyltransferase